MLAVMQCLTTLTGINRTCNKIGFIFFAFTENIIELCKIESGKEQSRADADANAAPPPTPPSSYYYEQLLAYRVRYTFTFQGCFDRQ